MDVSGGSAVVNVDSGTANEVAVDLDMGSDELFVEPAAGTTVIFSGDITGTGGIDTSNESGTIIFRGDNSGLSGKVDSTINGGRLGIGSDTALGTGTTDIRFNTTLFADGGDRTLANPLDWSPSQTVDFDGTTGNDLTFTGDGSFGNIRPLGGPGVLAFTGQIDFSNDQITAAGTNGRVNFTGDNTGQIDQIRDGVTIGIGHDHALGDTAGTIRTVFDPIFIAMNGPRTINQGFELAVTDFIVDGSDDLTVTGDIVDDPGFSGGLTKNGAGALALDGNNTYTEPTSVNAGSLLVNGAITSSNVTVANGATLGGSGTISQTVDVQSGGTLSPGNSPDQMFTGDLDLNAGSTLLVDVLAATVGDGTTGYDQVVVTGTVDLADALLEIAPGSIRPPFRSLMTIIDNDGSDPILGTFAGLNEGDTVFFNGSTPFATISYIGGDGNDVVLTALPEPTTAMLLLAPAALLLRRRA